MSNVVRIYKTVDLKAAEFNPRNITTEQMEGLKASIRKFGLVENLVVNIKSGNLVGGHMRAQACKELGITDVPVIEVGLSDTEEKALNIALNSQEISGNYTDSLQDLLQEIRLDFEEYDDLKLDMLEMELDVEVLPEEGEDDVPEVQPDPITKRGDVWLLGDHRVMCGDSTMIDDVEKLMNGENADMVFTDPPYNIGFKPQRGTHDIIKNDDMSDNEFRDFLSDIFSICKTVLKENTYLISFMGWSTISDFNYALKDLFEIKSMPIWVKNNFGIGYYTRPKYEPFYLCLNGKPEKPTAPPADVFEYAKVHKTVHSCEKPVEMLTGIADHFCKKGLFYEPFAGSGSLLIACEKTKRKCYGMELDEKYCDVIIKRWQDFTGKEATLETSSETYNSMVV